MNLRSVVPFRDRQSVARPIPKPANPESKKIEVKEAA
jgi:hypothetical protein